MAADVGPVSSGGDSAAQVLDSFSAWLRSSDARGTPLGRGYQAATELYRSPAGNFVVKTARGPWPWRALGEAAIRREHSIYRRIAGIPGVPQCLGLIDGRRLVLEHIDGHTFRRGEAGIRDRDAYFARLLDTLQRIHARGVAHGDLKRKDNLLVGPDDRPYLVDFGVASVETGAGTSLRNAMFRWMRQYDYNAWVKLKYRAQLGALPPEDAARYRPTAMERIARAIRVVWQKLTLRRLRRRIWPRR